MTAKTAFLPLASGFPDLVGHHRSLLDDDVRTNVRRAFKTLDADGIEEIKRTFKIEY